MGLIHVGGVTADDFSDAAEVEGVSGGVCGFYFLSEEDVGAGDACGFAAEGADHADEAGVDLIGEDF